MAKKPLEDEEDEAADDQEGGDGGKSKKKVILIAVIALVVLLIGGGAALYFTGMLPFGGSSDKKTEKADAKETKPGAQEQLVDKDGKPIVGAPIYYDLPEFLVNLNTGGKQTSFLKMRITLELPDQAAVTAVEVNLPKVVDSFNTYLRELRSSDLSGSAGVYRLRDELLIRINKTIAPSQVKSILFREILVQ